MLKKAYLLEKIGADTAENEQHSAEILPIGRRVADDDVPGVVAEPTDDAAPAGAAGALRDRNGAAAQGGPGGSTL